jgi:hypothetical protein
MSWNLWTRMTDAGGVGVRALSPRGNFLPESRTGFTRAWGWFIKAYRVSQILSQNRACINMTITG